LPANTSPATTRRLLPSDFDQRFETVFGLVAFAVNRHVMDHMRRVVADLGLDMDTAYVWGTLAHLNVAPVLKLGADSADVLNAEGMLRAEPAPARLADLAEITRLPRETVRRKLEQLAALGKVERTASGGWVYRNTGIDAQTRDFTRETVLRLVRTTEVILALLEQADQPTRASKGR